MSVMLLPVGRVSVSGLSCAVRYLTLSSGGRISKIVGTWMDRLSQDRSEEAKKLWKGSYGVIYSGDLLKFGGHLWSSFSLPFATRLAARVLTHDPFFGTFAVVSSLVLSILPTAILYFQKDSLSAREVKILQGCEKVAYYSDIALNVLFFGQLGFFVLGPIGFFPGIFLGLCMHDICTYFENKLALTAEQPKEPGIKN